MENSKTDWEELCRLAVEELSKSNLQPEETDTFLTDYLFYQQKNKKNQN